MNIYLALGHYKSQKLIEIFGFEIDKSKCEARLAELLKLAEFNGIAGTTIVEFGDEENDRKDIGQQIGDWLYDVVGCPEEEIQDTVNNIRMNFCKAIGELRLSPHFKIFTGLFADFSVNTSMIIKPENIQ